MLEKNREAKNFDFTKFDVPVRPETYKDRMVAEYVGLKEKYERLHRIIIKAKAHTLDFKLSCPLELLEEQAAVMGRYLFILEVRAEIEGVVLKPNFEQTRLRIMRRLDALKCLSLGQSHNNGVEAATKVIKEELEGKGWL